MNEQESEILVKSLASIYSWTTIFRWVKSAELAHLKRKAKYAPQAPITNDRPKASSQNVSLPYDLTKSEQRRLNAMLGSASEEQIKRIKSYALKNSSKIFLTSRRKP